MADRDRCIVALRSMAAHPTAPMFEYRVAAYILGELKRLGLPVRRDACGNIIATYEGPGAPQNGGIALVAHMDHPACELLDAEGRQAVLRGSVNKECFEKPVPVRFFPSLPPADRSPETGVGGTVTDFEETEDKRILLNLDLESAPPRLPAFGIWDFPPFELVDGLAYMRQIDDIVGCAVVLLTLEEIVRKQTPCRVYGVFTRSEETGFFGAIQLVQDKELPMDTVMVSLETSKTLPGADIGGGPVIRVGDTRTTCDQEAEWVLRAAWRDMVKEDPNVKVQRQLMTGGTCEATVFRFGGYLTTAMALPLGNYHNMTPDQVIAPEYISPDDMVTQVQLLSRAPEYVGKDNLAEMRTDIFEKGNAQRETLISTYKSWCTER